MAILDLSASGASTSSGTATLRIKFALVASGASVSAGTAACVILSPRQVNVTQAGLQVDVGGRTTQRVTQSGLQIDAGGRVTQRVTQGGLQLDVDRRIPVNVTQTGLGLDVLRRTPLNVTQAGLQIDAAYRRAETTVSCVEIFIQDRSANHLDYLENAFDKSYMAQVNDCGAGQFTIYAHDGDATVANLKYGNRVVLRYRNVDIGTWVIEEISTVLVSSGEGEEELATVSGRGLMATLERGIVYPSDIDDIATAERQYSAQTAADIFLDLYGEFQVRGGGDVTPDFTATDDSGSTAWTDSQTINYKAGQNLLEVLRNLAAYGVDFTVKPDGTLQGWTTAGSDLSDSVIFRQGKDILHAVEHKSGLELTNVALGENQAAFREDTGATSISTYGRHEVHVSAGNTSNAGQLGQANAQVLAGRRNPVTSLEVKVSNEYHHPFIDYDVGDTVRIEIPDEVSEDYRILSIAIEEVDGPCNLVVTLEVNSIRYDWLVRQQRAYAASHNAAQVGAAASVGIASTSTA